MGRERGPVHERGPGSGDDAAPEAGRPAGDRDRRWRWLPDLRQPSLQRRLTLAFLGLAIADLFPIIGIWDIVNNLYLQLNPGGYCGGSPPWMPSPGGECYVGLGERLVYLPVLAGFVALLVWIHWLLASVALSPLRAATRAVHAIGPQNMGQRVALQGGPDPLKELADSLDAALDRLAVGYESQRRFAANASHELRTPLAVQRVLAEVAMEDPDAGRDLHRLGNQVLRVNERSERLIEGMLVLAESDRGLPGKVPAQLDELARSVLKANAELAAKHKIELREQLDPRSVPGDPVLLERLITNLVANAIVYNEPGGWVEVTVGTQPAIMVSNSGPRIPAEEVLALFEPFRRLGTDRVSHAGGAGLGLSIVRSITTAHEGTIHVRARPDGGLDMAVELPG